MRGNRGGDDDHSGNLRLVYDDDARSVQNDNRRAERLEFLRDNPVRDRRDNRHNIRREAHLNTPEEKQAYGVFRDNGNGSRLRLRDPPGRLRLEFADGLRLCVYAGRRAGFGAYRKV